MWPGARRDTPRIGSFFYYWGVILGWSNDEWTFSDNECVTFMYVFFYNKITLLMYTLCFYFWRENILRFCILLEGNFLTTVYNFFFEVGSTIAVLL